MTRIVFRGLSSTESLLGAVERHAAHLARLSPRSSPVQVAIEARSRARRGGRFRISLDLGAESSHASDEDVYAAIRRAFAAARRRLADGRRSPRRAV
jgi:hypothetical protein